MNFVPKPVPVVHPWTKPFWEATRNNKLSIQRCQDCNKYIFYPKICCPFCFSDSVKWVEVSGNGTVYSFSIVVNNAPSAFANDIPYVVSIVKLDEGVQMLTNIVGCDPNEVCIGMPVKVTFEKIDDEFTLPKFMPK